MKNIFLALILVTMLSGCATLDKIHQQWLADNCNVNAAYTNGLSDGLKQGSMPNNYGNSCSASQSEISVAYLRGFSKGLDSRPKEVNVYQTVRNKSD